MTEFAWLDRGAWPWSPKFHAVPAALAGNTPARMHCRMHYIDEGPADAPPVVLVHGTPTWGFEWRHVVRDLAGRCRVIVPDHLGFGLSDRPADAVYTPEAHAARFADFLDARLRDIARAAPVTLVVHDFGGPIALDWALRNPERVRHVTVVNSWMWSFNDDAAMRTRAKMASGWMGRMLYRHANASLRLIMPSAYADRARLTRDIHAQYLAVFPDADSRERVLFALARALLDAGAYYDSLWNRRAALADTPMSIVWGLKDSAFPPHMLARWRSAFPHAEVTALPNAGHWPHEESPHAVVSALLATIAPH